MSLPKLALLLAFAAALNPCKPSQAQGLLGSLLRAPHPGPSSSPYGARTPNVPVLELVMRLDKGKWVIEQSKADGSIAPTSCRSPIPQDIRKMLMWLAAVRPIASQDLGTNAFVVKDGIEAGDPKWRVGVAVCSSDRPNTNTILHETPQDVLSRYGMNGTALLAAAADFIRQTDGSFPPPLTQADVQQSQLEQKFVFAMVPYAPNGEMIGVAGETAFDTAAECDRYTSDMIKRAKQTIRGTLVANSVLVPDNITDGYAWFGCFRNSDQSLPAFTKYFDTKMTSDRATQMARFPDISRVGAQPSSATQNTPAKESTGNQIKF